MRQRHGERAALAELRLHPHLAAVTFHDQPADVEPQARSRNLEVVVGPDPGELLEDLADLVGRDPETVVDDLHDHVLRTALATPNGDRAPPRRVLDRVRHEVRHDLAQPIGVRPDLREIRGHVHQDRVVGEPERHRFQDEGAQVDLAEVEAELSRLDLRDEQRVVGQQREVVRLTDDRLHELVARLDREVVLFQDQLREASDRHERPAEVVGHDAHELALQAVVLLQQLVGSLELVVQPQVLDGDRDLAGQGQQQVEVLVGERPVTDPIGHREKTEDRRPSRDRDDEQRPHPQLLDKPGYEARVRRGLVREQRSVLPEVPARAGLTVHRVAHALELLGRQSESGGLPDELAAIGVEEEHQAALGLQHLGRVARDVAEKGLPSSGERELPRHPVQPEELVRLLLKHAPLGLLGQKPAHPHHELTRLQRLGAHHLVHIGRRVPRIEVVEDQDPRVGAERLPHALDDRRHRRVDQRQRRQDQVGGVVDDLLDDPPSRYDHADAVTGGAEDVRQGFGALRVLVDDGYAARRSRSRDVHRLGLGSARRAVDAGEQVDDRAQRGARNGLDQVGIPAGIPACGVVLQVTLGRHEDDRDRLVDVPEGSAHRVAVHVGEVHVEQNQIEWALAVRRLQTVRPRSRLENLEFVGLLGLEDRPDQRPCGDVVVNHQHSLGHPRSSPNAKSRSLF